MKIITHHAGGADKLLRIEAAGCAVHITVGLHDADGQEFTAIEIEPLQPADNSDIWVVRGQATTVVVNHGPQVMAGDQHGVGADRDRPA
ncbi:hypothetical protein [Mycobacterium sp.]|uniref:hypothetical protein n=1 Tax=Mycobacterium sp. TaxID=1785 RepID=UPI003D0FCAAA